MKTTNKNLTDSKREVSAYDENNVVIILAGADRYEQDRDESWMVNENSRGAMEMAKDQKAILKKGGMVVTNTIDLDMADFLNEKTLYSGNDPLMKAWALADKASAYSWYENHWNTTEMTKFDEDDDCYWGSPSLMDRFFLYKGKLYKPFSHNEKDSNKWGIGGRLVFEMVSDCSE